MRAIRALAATFFAAILLLPATALAGPKNQSGEHRHPHGSQSRPDQDGRGMDRGIVNDDKTGPGADMNNGCGNDADREDDNNGWCGGKPHEERAESARVEGVRTEDERIDVNKAMFLRAQLTASRSVSPATTAASTTAASSTAASSTAVSSASRATMVLGEKVFAPAAVSSTVASGGIAARVAAASGIARVLGALARTGFTVISLLMLAAAAIGAGVYTVTRA